jgi:hypothetical protein
MDGNKTVRSLAGLRRDSEIMFLDKGGQFILLKLSPLKKAVLSCNCSFKTSLLRIFLLIAEAVLQFLSL